MFGHNLGNLYESIKDEYGKDLEKEYLKSEYADKNKTLGDYLSEVGKTFESWRYSYKENELNLNLNIISDILLMLDEYIDKQYKKVSQVLANKGITNFPKISLDIPNLDGIKDII